MVHIDKKSFRPAAEMAAMEEGFQSLSKSVGISSPDEYLDLRAELLASFDAHYRNSRTHFGIQNLMSSFADAVWRFAREISSSEHRIPQEKLVSAFGAFCESGRLVIEGPTEDPSDVSGEGAGALAARDVFSRISASGLNYILLMNAQGIGSELSDAAKILMDDHSGVDGFAERYDGALVRAQGGDAAGVSELSEMILGDDLVSQMSRLSDAFEDYFFGMFIEGVGAGTKRAKGAHERGDLHALDGGVTDLKGLFSDLRGAFDNLKNVFMNLDAAIKGLKKLLGDEDATAVLERHAPFMNHFASVGHDYTNFLVHMEEYLSRIVGGDGRAQALTDLENLCGMWSCATVHSMLQLIRFKRKSVALRADGMDRIHVPERFRRPLFRILFELVKNADKYGDPEKAEKIIRLSASEEGSILDFSVEDNGVGIRDVEKAVSWGEGSRQSPELASGMGVGLATVKRLARENSWPFKIESEVGVGTKASLQVDRSGWGDGAAGGGGGAGCGPKGDAVMLGASSPGGQSAMSMALGVNILVGFMPLIG